MGLSTHVLDTSAGRPAAGLHLAVSRLGPGNMVQPLLEAQTNANGRTDRPLIEAGSLDTGSYQIAFNVGDYFARMGIQSTLYSVVPIVFSVIDPSAHYHIALLITPWNYTTYRGS